LAHYATERRPAADGQTTEAEQVRPDDVGAESAETGPVEPVESAPRAPADAEARTEQLPAANQAGGATRADRTQPLPPVERDGDADGEATVADGSRSANAAQPATDDAAPPPRSNA
jgi:hypothetical protein